MATGDQNDILQRTKALLPTDWFQNETPILDALLQGAAQGAAFIYSLIQYLALQTRISTATDIFLDIISFDFFGSALPRKASEQDSPFRARILANLLRERGTRKGMIDALTSLTGRAPWIFEPDRVQDTGALGTGTIGLGVAGGLGSHVHNAQVFLVAYRPLGAGIPYIAGLGTTVAGLGAPTDLALSGEDAIQGNVTDTDIYAVIDATKPAGTTVWTQIQ